MCALTNLIHKGLNHSRGTFWPHQRLYWVWGELQPNYVNIWNVDKLEMLKRSIPLPGCAPLLCPRLAHTTQTLASFCPQSEDPSDNLLKNAIQVQ